MSDAVWVALIAAAGTVFGAVATIAVARIQAAQKGSQTVSAEKADSHASPLDRIRPGIEAIITSSNTPMYFTDHNLVVLCCNDSFVELMDTVRPSLVGKHISDILMRCSLPKCPEPLRDGMEKQQKELIGKILSDLAPHSEAIVFQDHRGLVGARYNGLYRIWVHADKVSPDWTSASVGVFVIFRVESIPDRTLQAVIRQAITQEDAEGGGA